MPVSEITYGIFKTEIKNRFLCLVEVDGNNIVCYIPSSCRLSNFIDLTDRPVMLKPIKKKNARTRFAVYAFKYRQEYVLLNLSLSNSVIEESIHRRFFSFLGQRKDIYRERIIDGYKSDLYIQGADVIIEVKSILSFDRSALFPTVFSERANRQLEDVERLLRCGHKVCYFFVSMYSGVKRICINEQQVTFCKSFRACIEKGMMVRAYTLGMKEGIPFLKNQVEVIV